MNNKEAEWNAVDYLRQASTIRVRCHRILRLARERKLQHFQINEEALELAADNVADLTKEQYPDLKVPYHSRWRHFDVGGIDRAAAFAEVKDPMERGRCLTELVIASVLLDAGAGDRWQFTEAGSGQIFARSEGLAVASFHMYEDGGFSSKPDQPHLVDANGLRQLSNETLAAAFQHRSENPLTGLEGRVALLKALGETLAQKPQYFGEEGRLGRFFDHLLSLKQDERVAAPRILQAVLHAFSDIWPGRLQIGGVNLGDVWRHPAVQTDDLTSGLVPFHKLSQWLTYSLLEPLEHYGIDVSDVDGLTGLPEYRNGGLLIDAGVLRPQYQDILTRPFSPDAEVIVEWRALTVALLDEIAPLVRKRLQVSDRAFPLAKVLQGGTWSAGRKLAAAKRPGGPPPISIISDGTVF